MCYDKIKQIIPKVNSKKRQYADTILSGGVYMKILLAEVRLEKEVSCRELSRKSGVALSHIHNIEQGYKKPGIEVICKLANALGVSPERLFSCDN